MAIFNKSEETDYLRQLKKSLSKNKRRQDNTLDAITESDSPSHRKRLAEKLTELEKEQAVLEAQIAKEGQVLPNISEQGIRFFLTELRKGNADDIRYRKTLIDVFVNRIYLYDDRITITYNSGDHPVTINDRLLSAMEAEAAEVEGLFLDGSAPPKKIHRIVCKFGGFSYFYAVLLKQKFRTICIRSTITPHFTP